jgi:hypothetical protein
LLKASEWEDVASALSAVQQQYAVDLTFISTLLLQCDVFDPEDKAKFLAQEECEQLLSVYLKQGDWTSKNFVDVLRVYFVNLKLAVPKNSVQADRLMEILAQTYLTANKSRADFQWKGDVDETAAVFHALIMLDDSLYGKNAVGRSRMSEKQFLEVLTDKLPTDIPGFSEQDMRRLFEQVHKCSIRQWPPVPKKAEEEPQKRKSSSKTAKSNTDGQKKSDKVQEAEAVPSGGSCCVVL